jgi:formate-dependent nitrite reductase cytochrome c552 subunit
MTQVADADTVAGPVNQPFSFLGQTYRLLRQGRDVWFQMDHAGPAGQPRRLRLVMITGSHHMQVYWYATGHSRKLGQVPFIYLIEEQQWIPRNATFLTPPAPEIKSALPGAWNMACIKCHTTQGKTRSPDWGRSEVALNELSFDTRVAEFGIACEACHGPGEAHVLLNRNPLRRYAFHLNGTSDPSIVQPAHLPHELSSQVCGQCHAILEFYEKDDFQQWMDHGYPYRPGQVLSESKLVVRYQDRQQPRLRQLAKHKPTYWEEKFWSDGMIRVSGREYNGLIETPCFQRGELSCLSCHGMHQSPEDSRPLSQWANDQLKPGMRGNHACLQCHDPARFDTPAHTHHPPASSGSRCYNCHMPYTTYGILKAIRSHQIDTPTVQASLQTGRPNACNQCHLDKTLDWAASHLEEWYDVPRPELSREERSVAASLLWLLRGDAGQRALMAWSLGWDSARHVSGSEWMPPFLGQLLEDPYDAVRFIAARSLRRSEAFSDWSYEFFGPTEVRAAAHREVLERWQGLPHGAGKPAVLIDANGAVNRDLQERLLRQRDDRVVSLAE